MFILAVGVFGIINTEMGVIGILPLNAETFHVTYGGNSIGIYCDSYLRTVDAGEREVIIRRTVGGAEEKDCMVFRYSRHAD